MSTKTSAARAIRYALLLVLVAVADIELASAHHAIAGQFDMTKTVRLSGVVTRVEWTNPHVYLHLDARPPPGASTVWKLETLPVAMLRKSGITKQMLMTGEVVDLDICPARDGTSQLGFILNIRFPDGRRFQFQRDPNAPATVGQ